MKTLYVHIGTPKTGTSAIQIFCEQNQAVLEKKGYCYPILPFKYKNRPARRNGAFLQVPIYKKKIRQYEAEAERMEEGLSMIRDLFRQYDNVILSDEGIWRASCEWKPTLWSDLHSYSQSNDFTVKVIVYLRRQDTLMESWWNQRLKGINYDKSYSWDEWMDLTKDDRRFDFYGVLEDISSSIGREHVIVRRFDRKLFPNGLIQYDFLNCLGLSMTDEYTITDSPANPGLYGNTAQIQHVLNGLSGMTPEYHKYFREVLRPCSEISGQSYPNGMLSVDEAKAFVEKYAEGNRKITEEYLHEQGAELFDMTFKDIPKWEKNNPYMLDDIIRFTGTSDMYLHEKLKEINSDLNQLEKEMKNLKNALRHPVRTVFRHTFRS